MSLSAEVSVGSLRMERKIRAAKEEDHLFTDCNWVFVIYGNKLDSAYRLLQHIKFRSTDLNPVTMAVMMTVIMKMMMRVQMKMMPLYWTA